MPPGVICQRAADIASRIGLDGSPQPEQLIDATLRHHESLEHTEVDMYLREAAENPIDRSFEYTRDELAGALAQSIPEVHELDRRVGPVFRQRWKAAATRLVGAAEPIGRVLDLSPGVRVLPMPEAISPLLYHRLQTAELRSASAAEGDVDGYTHVLGVDALDEIDPADLSNHFVRIGELSVPTATVSLSGTVVDADSPMTAYYDPIRDLTFFADQKPFFHRRLDLDRALLESPWRIQQIRGDVRVTLTLQRTSESSDASPATMSPTQLRRGLVAANEQQQLLRSQLAEETALRLKRTSELTSTQNEVKATRIKSDTAIARLETAIAALEKEVTVARENALRSDESLRGVAAEREALRSSSAEDRHQIEALNSRLTEWRDGANAARHDLTRLKGRRSVRMALRFSRLAKPAFRWRRRSSRPQQEQLTEVVADPDSRAPDVSLPPAVATSSVSTPGGGPLDRPGRWRAGPRLQTRNHHHSDIQRNRLRQRMRCISHREHLLPCGFAAHRRRKHR